MITETCVKNGKELRSGYTTGSCATAVATASTIMLITQNEISGVNITLPSGSIVNFLIDDVVITDRYASCSVTKFSGDDPDITDGAKIFGEVTFNNLDGIELISGIGVGIVTTKGLQCAVGEPAINPVPRKMIISNTKSVLDKYNIKKGITIKISVPDGERLAKKTFNPRLGIVGGISILGTTGIVEPMSEKALIDTIKVCVNKEYVNDPNSILISPGNYGRNYCQNELNIDINKSVKFSNFLGEALDYIKYKGFKEITIVGHFGKLVKVAGGIMNTHSSVADARFEIISTHCILHGADKSLLEKIVDCSTTDEAFDLIEQYDFYEDVKKSILAKALFHINYRLKDEIKIQLAMFGNDGKHSIRNF